MTSGVDPRRKSPLGKTIRDSGYPSMAKILGIPVYLPWKLGFILLNPADHQPGRKDRHDAMVAAGGGCSLGSSRSGRVEGVEIAQGALLG
jgi:hypothetical protein